MSGVITNSYVSGVLLKGLASCIGGLVGRNGQVRNARNATITNSCATCICFRIGHNWIGGLVGEHQLSRLPSPTAVRQALFQGLGERVGGLVGYSHQGEPPSRDSYATGSVSGDSSSVGGLVGNNDDRANYHQQLCDGFCFRG